MISHVILKWSLITTNINTSIRHFFPKQNLKLNPFLFAEPPVLFAEQIRAACVSAANRWNVIIQITVLPDFYYNSIFTFSEVLPIEWGLWGGAYGAGPVGRGLGGGVMVHPINNLPAFSDMVMFSLFYR